MPGPLFLFGGSKPFVPPPWKTTDDRLRGGASHSSLSALPNNSATFSGHLDIKTLGGAGFASQFSPSNDEDEEDDEKGGEVSTSKTNNNETWDLSAYDGIAIDIAKGDGKIYTLILRDGKSPGKRGDCRQKASINWEVDFKATEEGGTVWKAWKAFKATYRGKEKHSVGSLRTDHVTRVGIMMRSYFGTQEGDFNVELKSIAAKEEGGNSEL